MNGRGRECGASAPARSPLTPEHTPQFFRDRVYTAAAAEGRRVPWDVGAPQPALQTVSPVFSGKARLQRTACVTSPPLLPRYSRTQELRPRRPFTTPFSAQFSCVVLTPRRQVLDVGCGTGDNSRWLASLPGVASVTAVDFAAGAIALSLERSAAAPPPPAPLSFLQQDVLALAPELTGFDALLDSAVFHCIGDDERQRAYLASVTPRVKLGGRAVLLVFSIENGGARAPAPGPGEGKADAATTWAGWARRRAGAHARAHLQSARAG